MSASVAPICHIRNLKIFSTPQSILTVRHILLECNKFAQTRRDINLIEIIDIYYLGVVKHHSFIRSFIPLVI